MFLTGIIIDRCLVNDGFGKVEDENKRIMRARARRDLFATIGDASISLTAFVVGIVGALGFIYGMPPEAAYGLIGFSGFITFTWTVLGGMTKGWHFIYIAKLLQAAILLACYLSGCYLSLDPALS